MYKEIWLLFFREYHGLRMVLGICGITILVAMLEGLNIGLLVPLLETLSSPDQEAGHWMSRALSSLFGTLGLSYNLETILVALTILILITAGLKYLTVIWITRARLNFILWLRSRSMWKLLNADISYYHRQQLGMVTDMVTNQTHQAGGVVHLSIEILANLTVSVTFITTAFLIAPLLATVALVMVVILSLGAQWHIIRARTLGVTRVTNQNEFQATAVETLSGIHLIKSFLLERLRWADFNSKADGAGESEYAIGRNLGQMAAIQEVALFGLIGAVVYLGVSVLDLGIAIIVALLFVLYRLAPRVSGINARRQGLANALASFQGISTTIDEATTSTIISGEKAFVDLEECIELRDVEFSYEDGTEVLRQTSFIIEKGKLTAIAGSSGAGKTTIMDLILRHYDPVQGMITVDGTDLRELDLESWRTSIGIVSQDVFLFNDTVSNNIALGRSDLTMDSIIDAAQKAYAHEFILQLPQGYETRIGDRGWNLSGGQRQRMALARAILKQPSILILDEATSSLDSESEKLVHEYINRIRGTCTVIVVAHRLSTIQDADKIVVLEDGKVIEEGDWGSLTEVSGALANSHRLQSTL